MELHQALRHIIQTEGVDILTELRLINILVDLNAFGSIQGSKYIMRAIIADGFSSQFKSIGAMNMQANNLVTRFLSLTGFDGESTTKIFQSMAFGLGWINAMPNGNPSKPQKPSSPPTSNRPSTSSNLNLTSSQLENKSDSFIQKYKDDAEEYLDSVIDIKGDAKRDLGADLRAFCFYDTGDGSVSIHYEITGGMRIKSDYGVTIKAVFYGVNNRIIETCDCYIQKHEAKKNFLVKESDWAYEKSIRNIANIARIVIYWECE